MDAQEQHDYEMEERRKAGLKLEGSKARLEALLAARSKGSSATDQISALDRWNDLRLVSRTSSGRQRRPSDAPI